MTTTTQWARETGREFAWTCAIDNHDPTRDFRSGRGWQYDRIDDARGPGVILEDALATLRDAQNVNYIIDDGQRVDVLYVAGWHDEHKYVLLHPFPTDYDDQGLRRRRADNGEPVDFSHWMLGPRRAYHLKVVHV